MSRFNGDPGLIVQEILRILSWWDGIAEEQFYEFMLQDTVWRESEVEDVLSQLMATGYVIKDSGNLYANKNMPDMTAQNYEGYRFTEKGMLFGSSDSIWRVDELGNMVEIHEDPVGTAIVFTKDKWTKMYEEGKLEFVCNICCQNKVEHAQKQLYPVCTKCYGELRYKPCVVSSKDIVKILHNWRVYSDKVTPNDIRLFKVVQDDIDGDSSLYEIIFKDA